MAANYNLVTSQSTIQVLSPTVVQDVVVITIQTLPSLVIASLWVTQTEWEAGNAAAILSGYAANIEQVMASPKVESASSGPVLDGSGLQATEITFTVAYTPPGSPPSASGSKRAIRRCRRSGLSEPQPTAKAEPVAVAAARGRIPA